MSEVSATTMLGASLWYANGKTLEEALKRAEQWAKDNGVLLCNYYVQHGGRSILFDYEKENSNPILNTTTE